MFLKLLKHESHAAARSLLPLLGGLLAMSLLARGSIWLVDVAKASAVTIISTLFVALFFLSCFVAVVATMILMMGRFKRSVYSDEGYLTHTLPVNLGTILMSHLLISLLAVLASFAAAYLGFRIVTFEVHSTVAVGEFIRRLAEAFEIESGPLLLKMAFVGILWILTWILMIWAAIAMGHSYAAGKTGKSVLFFFALYFAQQIVSAIIVTLIPANTDTINLAISTLLWYVAGEYLFFCGVNYFLTWFMTKKHLNLA